jgi:hypothetical protein
MSVTDIKQAIGRLNDISHYVTGAIAKNLIVKA